MKRNMKDRYYGTRNRQVNTAIITKRECIGNITLSYSGTAQRYLGGGLGFKWYVL
jgi:hypothetical protein